MKIQDIKSSKKLTPLRAIRKKCLECMAGNPNEIKLCHLEKCPFWYYRFGRRQKIGFRIPTVIKSIKIFCYECSAFNKAEVRNCNIKECPVYLYRMGKNPNRKGIGAKYINS